MYVNHETVYTGKGNQSISYINLTEAARAIADMIESSEFPPALKPTVDLEHIIQELRAGRISHWHSIYLEFERSFGVNVRLKLELREVGDRQEYHDRTLQEYKFDTEIGASGTNYDLKSAMALNTLQARVIEFGAAVECMFVNYTICKVTMKEESIEAN